MERISDKINRIYQKYLPLAEELGISLNLDFPDTTLTLANSEEVAREVEKSVKSAVGRTKKGHVNIVVRPGKVTVLDSGTSLSKTDCERLSTEHVKVKSRVGFGTEVTIK